MRRKFHSDDLKLYIPGLSTPKRIGLLVSKQDHCLVRRPPSARAMPATMLARRCEVPNANAEDECGRRPAASGAVKKQPACLT